MSRYHALGDSRLAFAPLHDAASHYPAITEADFRSAIHLIEPDGTAVRGAEAMFTIMSKVGLRSWPLMLHRRLPPARALAEWGYRQITAHRGAARIASRAALGKVAVPSTLLLTRRVFVRLMGLIYLIAFLSFGDQAAGLIGSQGLRPAEVLMTMAQEGGAWWRVPTLQWLGGDGVLEATWIIGSVAAAFLILGLAPVVAAVTCWAMYLSLVTVGSVFLQYQWDALLLESGLLLILWAPLTWRLNSPGVRRPSRLVHWLIVLLLARLVFFGGLAKLQSGDPIWADCTALTYHFWTQPLPWWPAWFVAALPEWLLRAGCFSVFVIEFTAPLLLFLPRLPRAIGAACIALLMLAIAATGNYGFFNWLTIVLCIAMLDDATLLLLWPRIARAGIAVGLRRRPHRAARWPRAAAASSLLVLVLVTVWGQASGRRPITPVQTLQRAIAPWHPVGWYGLFATMTTTRPEILIEWQADDGSWHPIIFKWKPGPLDRIGGLCQPGMPRLDWQMWFDALAYERAWKQGLLSSQGGFYQLSGREVLPALLRRIMVLDTPVLDLLEHGPDQTPKAIRWHLDRYAFTSPAERALDSNWWTRTRVFSSPAMVFERSP
jgi:hypothetical protein